MLCRLVFDGDSHSSICSPSLNTERHLLGSMAVLLAYFSFMLKSSGELDFCFLFEPFGSSTSSDEWVQRAR